MPNVGGQKFPYTPAGMQMAKEQSAQTGQPVIKNYDVGGVVVNTNIKTPPHGKIKSKVTQGHKGYSKIVTWT